MSNDLIDSIQKQLTNIIKGVDDDTRAVAGGSAGYGKRISIKGGVFRKIVNGKEVGIVDERHMNVIFVKMAHNPSRTYYTGTYKEGAKVSPVCWSSDSKTPDPEVKAPQARMCNECPQSIKGSGSNGISTACRLSWRTAVVLPTDPGGDVMQMVFPSTTVWGSEEPNKLPFKAYIRHLSEHTISASRVVTKMQFDTTITAPTLRFSAAAAVKPEDVDVIDQQGKSAAAEQAIKLSVFHQDEGEAPAPAVVEATEVQPTLVKTESRLEAAVAGIPVQDVSDVVRKWSRKK